jgi:hypothetical protein
LTSATASAWQTLADLLDPRENPYVSDPVGWVRDPDDDKLAARLGSIGWGIDSVEAVWRAARSAQHHRWPSASRPINSHGLGRRHWETALRL